MSTSRYHEEGSRAGRGGEGMRVWPDNFIYKGRVLFCPVGGGGWRGDSKDGKQGIL